MANNLHYLCIEGDYLQIIVDKKNLLTILSTELQNHIILYGKETEDGFNC